MSTIRASTSSQHSTVTNQLYRQRSISRIYIPLLSHLMTQQSTNDRRKKSALQTTTSLRSHRSLHANSLSPSRTQCPHWSFTYFSLHFLAIQIVHTASMFCALTRRMILFQCCTTCMPLNIADSGITSILFRHGFHVLSMDCQIMTCLPKSCQTSSSCTFALLSKHFHLHAHTCSHLVFHAWHVGHFCSVGHVMSIISVMYITECHVVMYV